MPTWNRPAPAKPAGQTSTMSRRATNARVENGVVALRRTHAQRVPGLDDLVPGRRCGAGSRGRSAGPAGPTCPSRGSRRGPHRREAAEDLVAGDLPAAVDPLGLSPTRAAADVVAGLAVDCGEDLALGRPLQDPAARRVARAQEIGGHAGPVDVHVDRQRGRRCVVGEPPPAASATSSRPRPGRRTRWARQRAGSPTGAARPSPRRRSGSRGRRRRPLVEPGEHLVGQQSSVLVVMVVMVCLLVQGVVGAVGDDEIFPGPSGLSWCSTATMTSAGIPRRAAASMIASELGAS